MNKEKDREINRNENKKNREKVYIIILFVLLIILVLSLIVLYKINKNLKCRIKKLETKIDREGYEDGKTKDDFGGIRMPIRRPAEKPVIYLYPEKETEIEVTLGKPEEITHSYPKYKKPWRVIAKPNGDLLDLDTKKELYSLYYESETYRDIEFSEEGFVVKSEDVSEFLDEKLKILGLNYKERQEFIIYWLPRLESNNYTYIRFLNREEIEELMPLKFSKTPDTLIRVMMAFKTLDEKIDVKEQKLTPILRSGFTVVEWGGTEIK